jgi:hypothetical protein
MNPEEEEGEDGTMAVHEPTFRSLGARVNAYIPVTDRGFNGLLQPRDLKPLQPPSAPTLRLHTASGDDDVCGVFVFGRAQYFDFYSFEECNLYLLP